MIGQYPTPPPVATGPGLDRPIYVPGGGSGGAGNEYGNETYTMNRTRLFYQDQMEQESSSAASAATVFQFPSTSVSGSVPRGASSTSVTPSGERKERRISGGATGTGSGPNSVGGGSGTVAYSDSPRRMDGLEGSASNRR